MDGKLRNMTSLYITKGDRILLLYRVGSRVIFDSWTGSAGGHFEEYELNDARACVLRELNEETGLAENDLKDLQFRYLTVRLKNGEMRQNYYFFAELADCADESISSGEGELKWFDISEISALEMPFSSKYVILHWLETGRFNDKKYGGIAQENGVEFTALEEF